MVRAPLFILNPPLFFVFKNDKKVPKVQLRTERILYFLYLKGFKND